MGIVVHSPFSGRPVKVRDQDVGRAVRDEEGRIFYVLVKSGGEGHYGAITRAGGEKDEARYDQMLAKMNRAKDTGDRLSYQQIHDNTGGRRLSLGKALLLLGVLAAAVGGYLYATGALGSFFSGSP